MGIENNDLQEDTEEGIFDLQSILAQVKEEAETPTEDDTDDVQEDGPELEEEGELSDEEDVVESEDEDEAEEEDLEEESEEPEEESEPEAEAEEPDDEPEPEEPEAKVDPKDEEIRQLRELVKSAQDQQQAMLQFFQQQHLSGKQPPSQTPKPQVPKEVVRMALFGGADKEQWEKLDPATRAAAERVTREYLDREVEAALDPSVRYKTMQQNVLQDVYQMLEPFIQDFHNRRAQEVYNKHASDLQTEEDKSRVFEIMQTVPVQDPNDWNQQSRAFELAVKLYRAERKEKAVSKKEQKLTAKERQQQARRKPRKGRRPKKTGVGPARKEVPAWDPSLDLGAYAEQLKNTLE